MWEKLRSLLKASDVMFSKNDKSGTNLKLITIISKLDNIFNEWYIGAHTALSDVSDAS